MPDLARQLEWHSDHDIGDVVLDNECLDRRHVAVGSRPCDHGERMRGDPRLVGHRDADRLAADVEAERAFMRG